MKRDFDTGVATRGGGANWISAAINLLVIAAVIAYLGMSPLPGRYEKDWVHLWTAGRMIAEGHGQQLYDPRLHHEILEETFGGTVPEGMWPVRNQDYGVFFYPPPAAMFYAAFGWMPRGAACSVHACLCVALAVLNGKWLSELTRQRVSWAAAVLAILAFPPFFANFSIGQNAMVSMTLVVGAWRLLDGRREFAAGLLLGLFVCKPNWLASLAWIPLLHGRWRVLAGMAVGAGAAILATAAVVGVEPFADYAEMISHVYRMEEMPGYDLQVKCSAMGLFRKWVGVGATADVLGWTCGLAVVGATAWATRGLWWAEERGRRLMMMCSIAAALWLNPHLNDYDLMLLSAGAVMMAADWSMLTRNARWVAVALLVFVYAADPWDHWWSLWREVPLPCFALLMMWAWFEYRVVMWKRAAA